MKERTKYFILKLMVWSCSFSAAAVLAEPTQVTVDCGNFDETLMQTEADAHKGIPAAQYLAAKIFLDNKCIPKDEARALEWLNKAANAGHVEAAFQLGLIHYNAAKTDDEYNKALTWFMKAKDLGDTHAYYYLGEAYLNGRGVEQDRREAERWFSLASTRNDPRAQYQIAALYDLGMIGRRDARKAFAWYTRAALAGYNDAHFKLGQHYMSGHGVRRDRVKAYTWYAIAGIRGHDLGLAKKNELVKTLPSDKVAEAQLLIDRYLKSIESAEQQ